MILQGTGVALVTPFREDKSIDFESLKKLLDHVSDGGVEYLVLLGSTAEAATLSESEKKSVIDFVVKQNDGKLPLVLGLGGNNTSELVEEIKNRDLSDFAAILSVSPYYNRPSQQGIYHHFSSIARVCPIDIILYNVPSRTASNINPETAIRLAKDFKNIVAIKEASGDLPQAMRLIKDKPNGFEVLSGDDLLGISMIFLGGKGVISVVGQAIPREFSEMVRLALDKKVDKATKLQYEMMDIIDLAFEEGNPTGVKCLLESLGICLDEVRLPLISASKDLKSKIKDEFKRYN